MIILRSILFTGTLLIPTLVFAAPPEGPDGKPPAPPSCSYSDHTCLVSSPDLTFVVSKINDITPSSSNDCKLLPPCGHRPPPCDAAGQNPPPPPAGDNALPKPERIQ